MTGTAGELVRGRVRDGKVELRYELAGTVYLRQRVDPASPRSREQFLKALRAVYPGLDEQDEAEVERELLQLDVDELSGRSGGGGQGRALELRVDEPWHDPVDGAELLDEVVAIIRRFVVLPLGGAEALALWIAHTYLFDCADTTPRLGITSPEKGCGKTTVLELLAALVLRPLSMSNVTTAAVFRAIDLARPTLLVDEADSFLIGREANDELRGVLNSGHARGGSVIRCVGDDVEPRVFSTFAPCAIALIGELPATLEDRAIGVRMRRRAPGETVSRMRRSKLPEELEPLRRRLTRWADDHRDELHDADPDLSALEALPDRARDNWRLPLAIADAAGGDWPSEGRAVALQLAAAAVADDHSAGVMLLGDLKELFASRRVDKIATQDVLHYLVGLEDRPWAEWRRGQPITARGVAKLLAPYDIKPKTVRILANTPRGYDRDDLTDAWERYLPREGHSAAQQRHNRPAGPVPGRSEAQQPGNDVAHGIGRKSAFHAGRGVVADQEGTPPNSAGGGFG